MKARLFFLLILLNIYCSRAQDTGDFTDVKERGFLGKVKVVTQYIYAGQKTIKKDTLVTIANKNDFDAKVTYYFNEKGNADSVVQAFRIADPVTGQLTLQSVSTVYSFDEKGRKKGYKYFGVTGNFDRDADITWIDKTHYKVTVYSLKGGGKRGSKIEETTITLTNDLRELSYDLRDGGPMDLTPRHFITTNTLDKENHLTGIRVKFKTPQQADEQYNFINQKFDQKRNVLETYQTAKRGPSVTRFFLSEYIYY